MALLGDVNWCENIYSGGWIPTMPRFRVMEPATGRQIAVVAGADPADVDLAVQRAASAQPGWAAVDAGARAAVLHRAADLFVLHAEEIAVWGARETGTPLSMARRIPLIAAEECREAAALATMPHGDVLHSKQPRLSFSRRTPVGVVGVIAPFNAPLLLALRSVAPALALGNAVVVKPDPRTAVSGGVVLARVFEEAGVFADVLHVLPGECQVGEALVEDPLVPVIAFTGSTSAGRAIAKRAGELLKRVHLELGGNSALIVLEDADVERAAAAGAFGSFRHAGQICMAVGRHLVHERIAEDYVAALAARASNLRVADPVDEQTQVGPLIDLRQRDRVHSLVRRSLDLGATRITGADFADLHYEPTVLTTSDGLVPSYAEEVFGPVATVRTFASDEEAVALAKDTKFGLSLGVLTRDVMRGLNLADRIPTGMVHINDQTINDETWAPFGGVGDSGTDGRHGGRSANLHAFTDLRWITMRGSIPTRVLP